MNTIKGKKSDPARQAAIETIEDALQCVTDDEAMAILGVTILS